MSDSQITKNVRYLGVATWAVLAVLLLVALGSWGLEHAGHEHGGWSDLLNPRHFFSLLGVIGSVLGAWLSKSPLK